MTRLSWSRVVVLALAAGCYQGAFVQAGLGLVRPQPWNWAEMGVRGGFWAVGMAGVVAMQSAGWFFPRDEREGRAIVRTAMTTGDLPPDARVDAWRPVLAQEIRELRLGRWITVPFMALVAVLVAAAAMGNDDPGVSVLAIALGGFVGVPLRLLHLRRKRAEALLAQVDARQ